MTDSNAAQAPAPLPLTEHEFAALTTLAPGDPGPTSARLVGADDTRDNAALVQAGYATLLVRGLGEVSGETFTATGKGEVVAAIVNQATDWLRVHYADGEGQGITCIVRAPLASLFIEFTPNALLNVTPVDASLDVLRMAGNFLGAFGGEPVLEAPFRVELTRLAAGGADRGARIEVVEPGLWRFEDADLAPDEAWAQAVAALGYQA